MDKRMDDKIRERVFRRDGYTCRYCGNTKGPFHADHVYPYSKGGETSIDNMVTACAGCNMSKHDRVGVWPKPIGYFGKKPKHSPYITILTLFGVVLLVNSVLNLKDGYVTAGSILFYTGLAISFLSIAWNLTRSNS